MPSAEPTLGRQRQQTKESHAQPLVAPQFRSRGRSRSDASRLSFQSSPTPAAAKGTSRSIKPSLARHFFVELVHTSSTHHLHPPTTLYTNLSHGRLRASISKCFPARHRRPDRPAIPHSGGGVTAPSSRAQIPHNITRAIRQFNPQPPKLTSHLPSGPPTPESPRRLAGPVERAVPRMVLRQHLHQAIPMGQAHGAHLPALGLGRRPTRRPAAVVRPWRRRLEARLPGRREDGPIEQQPVRRRLGLGRQRQPPRRHRRRTPGPPTAS